jgi:hypothetical protein
MSRTSQGSVSRFRHLLPILLLAAACDYPHWRFDDIALQARFEADGSCSFTVAGKSLSTPTYTQEVANWRDDCTGCAAETVDAYRLVCRADPGDESALSSPVLYVTVTVLRDSRPEGRTFEIGEGPSPYHQPGADASVLQVPGISGGGLRTGLTGAHLMAGTGAVEVETLRTGEAHRRGGLPGRVEASLTASMRRKASGF